MRAGVVMAAFFHCGWDIYLWFIFNVVCTEVWHSGGLAVRVQSGPWGLDIKMYQLKELRTTEQNSNMAEQLTRMIDGRAHRLIAAML